MSQKCIREQKRLVLKMTSELSLAEPVTIQMIAVTTITTLKCQDASQSQLAAFAVVNPSSTTAVARHKKIKKGQRNFD